MKVLSRILTICLCSVPLVGAFADGPVATTSGSNLTAYNPSSAFNNQWATMSNSRSDSGGTAKADMENCKSAIARCAQPKCGNGGCADMSVAEAIVRGCVQSNNSCKKYGDDLISAVSAQMVANSNVKLNAQKMQLEQQKMAAEAAAAQNNNAAEQLSQMQTQMYQMQQQMLEQQEAADRRLQEALSAQQTQAQQALSEMKDAATAAAQKTESGISMYEEKAIQKGANDDLLTRRRVSGEILTEIENAELKLKQLNAVMGEVFRYAGCDFRGNNCKGPKRVKRFRELASGFVEPYEEVVNKIYDAIEETTDAGVDTSDIIMMLDNSCQRWAQFMCPAGSVEYPQDKNGMKSTPYSCPSTKKNKGVYEDSRGAWYDRCITDCLNKDKDNTLKICKNQCQKEHCKPCTQLKVLKDKDAVYEGWVDADYDDTTHNTTVIACADNAITSHGVLGGVQRRRNSAALIGLDAISNWINQTEPEAYVKENDTYATFKYCKVDYSSDLTNLKSSVASKTLKKELCVKDLGSDNGDETCPYINKLYALCDTHAYNIGKKNNTELDSSKRDQMKEVIGLKSTVLSQQLYKQYEYLNATIRRLKSMLKKAVYKAEYEAAGASSESGSTSSTGGLAGSKGGTQYRDCAGKSMQNTLECLNENYSELSKRINAKTCDKNDKKELVNGIKIVNRLLSKDTLKIKDCKYATGKKSAECSDEPTGKEFCKDYLDSYAAAISNLQREEQEDAYRRYGSNRF